MSPLLVWGMLLMKLAHIAAQDADLIIQDVTRNSPYYKIQYCNVGSGTGGTFTLRLTDTTSGKSFQTNYFYPFDTPAPGECAWTGGITCGLIGDNSCNKDLCVEGFVDDEDKVSESDETNNKFNKCFGNLADPCADVTCTALDQCHDVGVCADGECSNPFKDEGSPCDDGDSSTESDKCMAGVCGGISTESVPDADLIIQDVTRTSPYYKIQYCNVGSGTGGTFTLRLTDTTSGKSFQTNYFYPFDTPAPGECAWTGGITCGLIGDNNCNKDLCVQGFVDDESKVSESDETNNNFNKCFGNLADPCADVVCTALGQCHDVGVCADGECSNPFKEDGSPCDDGDSSTESDQCMAGVCGGISTERVPDIDACADIICAPLDQCHDVGICTDGECSNPPKEDGTPCDDGDSSTEDDQCTSGICGRTPACKCGDGKYCTMDSCDTDGACIFTPRDCSDDDDSTYDLCDNHGVGCFNPPKCVDLLVDGHNEWRDFVDTGCEYYMNEVRCSEAPDYENDGLDATQVCCSCGGGTPNLFFSTTIMLHELTARIDNLEAELNIRISTMDTSLSAKIDAIDSESSALDIKTDNFQTELRSQITNTETSLTTKITDFQTEVHDHITTSETSLTTNIYDLQTEVQGHITTWEASLATKIDDFQTEVNERITTSETSLTTRIDNSEMELDNKIDALQTNVANQITNSQGTITTRIDALQNDVNNQIDNCETSMSTKMQTLQFDVNSKISTSESAVSTKIADSESTLDTALLERLALLELALTTALETSESNVTNRVDVFQNELDTDLGDRFSVIQDHVDSELSGVNTSIKDVKYEIKILNVDRDNCLFLGGISSEDGKCCNVECGLCAQHSRCGTLPGGVDNCCPDSITTPCDLENGVLAPCVP